MRVVCALVTLIAAGPMPLIAADHATVAVSVQVAPRTSLHVSTQRLEFVVPEGSETASAVLDFTAAARVARGDAVVLGVEPAGGVEGPGGASAAGTSITFSGEGDGTQTGVLSSCMNVAGRWQGSGQRTGRIRFTLRASRAGVYAVTLRLAVQTP